MDLTPWLSLLDTAGFHLLRGLLALLWQSCILFGATGLLAYLLRRRHAAVRHSLWTGAILIVPLLPLLAALLTASGAPRKELAVIPRYTEPVYLAAPAPALPEFPSESSAPVPVPRFTVFDYPWALGLALYLAGASFFLAFVGLGGRRIRKWIQAGWEIPDRRALDILGEAAVRTGVSRVPRIVEHSSIPAPLTAEIVHPVILFPGGLAATLADGELRAVFAHELAHIRRNDPLILAVISLIRAVLFFHPLVWYAARQAADLAEHACDDMVLETGCEPVEYAELLSRLAVSLRKLSFDTELAAGLVFSRHAFLRRVEAILSGRRERIRRFSRWALAGTVAVAALSLGVALALPLGERKTAPRSEPVGTVPNTSRSGTTAVAQLAVKPGHRSVEKPGGDGAAQSANGSGTNNIPAQIPETVVYTQELPMGGPLMLSVKISFKAPGKMRLDWENGSYDVCDEKTMLTVDTEKGEFVETAEDSTNTSKGGSAGFIERLLSLPARAEKTLGVKKIEGRSCRGYLVREDGEAKRVWVDSRTGELALVEIENVEKKSTTILKGFQFNESLDDSLFKLVPPPGYTRKPSSRSAP